MEPRIAIAYLEGFADNLFRERTAPTGWQDAISCLRQFVYDKSQFCIHGFVNCKREECALKYHPCARCLSTRITCTWGPKGDAGYHDHKCIDCEFVDAGTGKHYKPGHGDQV